MSIDGDIKVIFASMVINTNKWTGAVCRFG